MKYWVIKLPNGAVYRTTSGSMLGFLLDQGGVVIDGVW